LHSALPSACGAGSYQSRKTQCTQRFAPLLPASSCTKSADEPHPFLRKLYADGGYQGPLFQAGLRRAVAQLEVEIVKRSDAGKFVVLPKRWIVERTIAWLNRCRRLAKDWECLNRRALAFLRLASIRLMIRKLCQTKG